jgi:hypothetical protein
VDDLGAELRQRMLDLEHGLFVVLVRPLHVHHGWIALPEELRDQRVVHLEEELPVRGPLLDERDARLSRLCHR